MKQPSFLLPRKAPMARSRVSRYSTVFQDSTMAEKAWGRSQGRAHRWAVAGALFGLCIGLLAFAPAAWLAQAVAQATHKPKVTTATMCVELQRLKLGRKKSPCTPPSRKVSESN